MKETIFSIVVPAYNVENYIFKCIESLVQQTYKNIEIIIVNDGSTDGTSEIIEKMAKEDNRIKVINQQNKGVNLARKKGVEIGTGDYFLFVDADDWLESKTVEVVSNKIEKYNVDIVRFLYMAEPSGKKQNMVFGDKETYITKNEFYKIYQYFTDSLKLNTVWGQAIKKSLLNTDDSEAFNTKECYAEDLWLNMELYTRAQSILFIQEYLYHYQENNNSTTRRINKQTIKNNVKNAISIHYKLFNYIKVWGIDNKENRAKIAFKLLNASAVLSMKLFYCKDISNREKIEILKELFENTKMDKIRSLVNNRDLRNVKVWNRRYFKSILNKKYNKTLYYNLIAKIKNI